MGLSARCAIAPPLARQCIYHAEWVYMQVKQLYTAPTLIRSLMGAGDSWVTQHDRSSLQVLGTVGEPINPIAWQWYHQVASLLHLRNSYGQHDPNCILIQFWA